MVYQAWTSSFEGAAALLVASVPVLPRLYQHLRHHFCNRTTHLTTTAPHPSVRHMLASATLGQHTGTTSRIENSPSTVALVSAPGTERAAWISLHGTTPKRQSIIGDLASRKNSADGKQQRLGGISRALGMSKMTAAPAKVHLGPAAAAAERQPERRIVKTVEFKTSYEDGQAVADRTRETSGEMGCSW